MEAGKLISRAAKTLDDSPSIDHWQKGRGKLEANELLTHAIGHDPRSDEEISAKDRRRFEGFIDRRASGEPIPYIKGYTDFLGLELLVEHGVFVPRDSSEYLATQAIKRLRPRKKPVHLDLATGLGTIALAVSDAVPKASVFGTDLSAEAVKLARKNAKRLGLPVEFDRGDLFGAAPKKIKGKVDVITLHPPYVAKDEVQDLPDEIRKWEPKHTLTDNSDDGLGLVKRAVAESPAWLRPNGWLLMEVDPDRARDVMPVYRKGGFRDVKSTKGGELKITRVIVGRPPR
jgi:release factor glutamine methyltransferase